MHTTLHDLAPTELLPSPQLEMAPIHIRSWFKTTKVFFATHWALLLLLPITIFGCIIRFHRLTFPTLWNDESLVYWRVCGTYLQMLTPLSTDGFPPLHYSLYWLVGHYTKLTPFTMRFIPALAGTLTIPAVYFFARQILPKSTSLVAALFTASSAFMLFYSRDAKMYPHTWLFVSLNLGCLLCWFRTMRGTAWLCWIATGCAMVGLHASALVVLGVSAVMFLTQRKMHWKKGVFFVVGLVIIASGPIGYFTKFNHWTENVDERGWGASGIGWVGWFNEGRSGPQHFQYTTAAFLTGWEWPRDDYLEPGAEQPIQESLVAIPMLLTQEVIFLLLIGLFPWPLILRRGTLIDPSPEPPWRIFFWLSCLTVVCAYGFYCISVPEFVSPVTAFVSATDQLRDLLIERGFLTAQNSRTSSPDFASMIWRPAVGCSILFALVTAVVPKWRSVSLRFIKSSVAMGAVFIICMAIFKKLEPLALEAIMKGKPWKTIWTPRYLGFMWPAFGIIVACLLMRLPTRAFRIAAIVFVCAANLAMADLRMHVDTEAPLAKVAEDVWASQPKDAKVRAYARFDRQDAAVAGSSLYFTSGRYYMQMLADIKPMSPDGFKQLIRNFRIWRNTEPNYIVNDIRQSPQLNRIVVWEDLPPRMNDRPDDLSRQLHGWKLISAEWSTIRVYWDWRERWKYLRREYVRLPEGPSKKP